MTADPNEREDAILAGEEIDRAVSAEIEQRSRRQRCHRCNGSGSFPGRIVDWGVICGGCRGEGYVELSDAQLDLEENSDGWGERRGQT